MNQYMEILLMIFLTGAAVALLYFMGLVCFGVTVDVWRGFKRRKRDDGEEGR